MTSDFIENTIIDEDGMIWYIYNAVLFNVDQDDVHPILTDNQITILKLKYGSDLYAYSTMNNEYTLRPL